MSTQSRPTGPAAWSGQLTASRLWLVGAAAIVASAIVNLLIESLAVGVFGLPAEFPPFASVAIIASTLIGVGGATVVFGLVQRLSRQPARTFITVAIVALVVSLIPNALALVSPDGLPFPGTSPTTIGALSLMHLAAAAISVTMLTKFAPTSGLD